jgi:DNA-damage-inducible protein J
MGKRKPIYQHKPLGKLAVIPDFLPVLEELFLKFERHVPNKLTADTLEKSERSEDVYQAKDADDLFKQLGL